MQTLARAPSNLIDIIARSGGLPALAEMGGGQRKDMFRKLGVVAHIGEAEYGGKGAIVAAYARTLGVSSQVIHQWSAAYRQCGWTGLVDGRRCGTRGCNCLPDVTRAWIQDEITRSQRNDAVREVRRAVISQWRLWQRTGDPQWAVPGYPCCPPDAGRGYPAGWSYETFLRCQPGKYGTKLARQGTIAAYRALPSILSTCVGTRYLEYVFFDDEKPDVHIRVPGFDRPMVPLCFHALDRLTRYPFEPHIRLRWYDTDAGTHKHLTQKEFVWYVIWMLCTQGYRTDAAGTTYVQEHGTAKVWSNRELRTPNGFHSFEDALGALTGGHARMDASGLFTKPAFAELMYGPQSSGNPRFKAPIESSFHLWRTYSQNLIGQTGKDIAHAPEENYGITKYEKRMVSDFAEFPLSIQEGIQSNYLTGIEFATVAGRIREALASRSDHRFEGWGEMNFMEPVWRWSEDPVGVWRSRSELANLPQHLREHARHQQKQNPRLTDIIPWSPAVAKLSCEQDPAIAKLSMRDAVHLIPTSWLKPVRVRDRHEIHLTEDLMPGEELIYLPELTTPRGRTEYLQPGDELMVALNPLMPESVLVYDPSYQFLGTITRSVRTGRDMNQVEEMLKQRARLKGALEAPVRRALQPVADRRAAVRALNEDLIAQARNVTPPATAIAQPKRERTPHVDPLSADLTPCAAAEPEADPFL